MSPGGAKLREKQGPHLDAEALLFEGITGEPELTIRRQLSKAYASASWQINSGANKPQAKPHYGYPPAGPAERWGKAKLLGQNNETSSTKTPTLASRPVHSRASADFKTQVTHSVAIRRFGF